MTEINAQPAKGMEEKPVELSLSKLTAGIGTVFAGVIQMLEAIDVSSARRLVDQFYDTEAEGTDAGHAADTAPTAEEVTADKAPDADTAETAGTPAADAEETGKPSTLSQDDITRVIVRKIKQNRANSEKIASILKTYGAERVSDLAAEKYEAFLTDISAI